MKTQRHGRLQRCRTVFLSFFFILFGSFVRVMLLCRRRVRAEQTVVRIYLKNKSASTKNAQLEKEKHGDCWTHRFWSDRRSKNSRQTMPSSLQDLEFQSDAKWIMYEKIWMIRALAAHRGCCFASIDSRWNKQSACANFKLDSKRDMEQTTWRDGGLQGSERESTGEEGNGSTRPSKLMLDILDIPVIIELSPHNLSPPNSTLFDALPSIRPSAVYIRLFVVSSTFPPLSSTRSLPAPPLCWPLPNFGHCLATLRGDCDCI